MLESALKLYGGKAIINSINFEDGEEPAAKRVELAQQFGAAVIALTIDEAGHGQGSRRQARHRPTALRFRLRQLGLPQSDLMIDPLTFTICTGNEDDRKLGARDARRIELIARELPECQIILGLSNISFGLKPAARACAEFGVSRPCAETRNDRRDRPCLQDRAAAQDPPRKCRSPRI